MFYAPEHWLKASNSAIIAAEGFLVPITIHTEGKNATAALDTLQKVFVEVSRQVPHLAKTAPGLALVPFTETIAPTLSRVQLQHTKDYHFRLTMVLKAPIPTALDFWSRLRLIATIYEQLWSLATSLKQKHVEVSLGEARFDQQKDTAEEARPLLANNLEE